MKPEDVREIHKHDALRLIQLMQENPDAIVVPMVESDGIIGDDFYNTWEASIGHMEVDYIYPSRRDDRMLIKSDTDPFDAWDDLADDGEETPSEEDLQKWYDSIPWVKIIAVNICTPDDIDFQSIPGRPKA